MCMSIVLVVIPAGLRPQTLCQQLVARDGPAGMKGEIVQQLPLALRKLASLAVVESEPRAARGRPWPPSNAQPPDGRRSLRRPLKTASIRASSSLMENGLTT